MKEVDFFNTGARLALEQWRQAVRAMEAAIDAAQPEASTTLEQAESHAHICARLAEQYKSDPVLFAALTDAAAIIRDLMRERLGASATGAGQAEIEALRAEVEKLRRLAAVEAELVALKKSLAAAPAAPSEVDMDEYRAMVAAMERIDPATLPGLTAEQRCALSRFAKPAGGPAGNAQPKRRPYNASGSLSEYGIFPDCDAAPGRAGRAAQAEAEPRLCLTGEDDDAWCAECGAKLETVRPGKHSR